MPRNIIIPDDLEARIRRACDVHAGQFTYASPILNELRDLLDASHTAQRDRAEQHARDLAAFDALIDHPGPCTCGAPSDDALIHRWNGAPCRRYDRVDL